MISEPKVTAAKTFQFPALVALAPKRRFKASGTSSLEQNEVFLLPSASPALRRRRLRKSGHLSVRWTTPQREVALADAKIESPEASECPVY